LEAEREARVVWTIERAPAETPPAAADSDPGSA
jgi:hypothetical protein